MRLSTFRAPRPSAGGFSSGLKRGWSGRWRGIGRRGGVLLALVCGTAVQAAEPIPIANFFRNAAVQEAVLSPDGSHVAALMADGPGNRNRVERFLAKNLAPMP